MKNLHELTRPDGGDSVLQIEFEQEKDDRWIADIPALPGVMAYGETRQQARNNVEALALRTLADRVEHGEQISK